MSDSQELPDSQASGSAAAKSAGRVVLFQEQHEIYFDQNLPRLNTVGARVYRARSVRGLPEIAYVSERSAIPRIKFSERYQALQNPVCARLVARGVLRCPDGFERYVFIYENTIGNPLVPGQGEPAAYNMRPDLLIATILRPVHALLSELHNTDLAHGAIRVDNLFDGGHQPMQSVRLGDCLTQAYLATQPALFLPPNLAVAMPSGRGLEMGCDDIYALGVTCAILLRSHDTTYQKSDEEILMHKLEFGTFSTLIESERLPPNVLELLRGMLQDDPVSRWTVQDMSDWFDGKRTSRRPGSVRLKGSRHINFGMQKILLPSVLAYHMPKDVTETLKLSDGGDIRQWVRRSVSDAKLDHRCESAIESISDYIGSSQYAHRLAARLAVAMEPSFPIMYQGLNFFVDSIGYVLAELIIQGRDPKPVIDLINDQMMVYWMNAQSDVPSDINLAITRSEQCQQFLKQKGIGYGVERCAYFLAPDIPCLSPNLRGFYVNSPEHLLFALNQIASTNDRPERILDRHMVAFLSIRDRQLTDPHLPDLNSTDLHRQVSGTINVLAGVQKMARLSSLPGLSKWIHAMAEPLYDRYHDRDTRATIRKKLNDLKDQGHVARMADLLFDPTLMKRDRYDYRIATHEYYQLTLERHGLQEALKYKDRYGAQTGREIAALLAGVMMAIAVIGFVLIRLTQGTMPW